MVGHHGTISARDVITLINNIYKEMHSIVPSAYISYVI